MTAAHAATVEAAVSAYVLTSITRTGRRPMPDDVATFRMYVERALLRGGAGRVAPPPAPAPPPPPDDDDDGITRPTRPHARTSAR